ncbi:hypothetical protein OMAG_001891 [Candidatus Omnitrophus magneticus]|uniref:Uncharacterized protein n=1 Tax=Candidatus Omnitrophus magneticus TaxID=1609969 RepID=A0A0F0CRW1_9BACT|nr:hypothetical protein OMAG_001891 [Candidatus Omnitrophus magneticus]
MLRRYCKNFIVSIFIAILINSITIFGVAENLPNEKSFFSFDRYNGVNARLAELLRDKGTRQDIELFAQSFLEGMRFLKTGDNKKALEFFVTAWKAWPEYFNPKTAVETQILYIF